MYLLRYKRDGEWRLVIIAEAYSVAHARMIAAGLEAGRFGDGHRVSRASAARLPPDAVGRVLAIAELTALVEGKKKPRAPSVRRPRGAGVAVMDSDPGSRRPGNAQPTLSKSGHRARHLSKLPRKRVRAPPRARVGERYAQPRDAGPGRPRSCG
jgi:hypothetical protein